LSGRLRSWLPAALLVLGVLFVYAPVGGHGWVSYDDEDYVTANPHVARGLAWSGVRWAFTHEHAANYHPLTWIAHMLGVEAFGLAPGPHHWVSVGLHALNAVLVARLLLALLANAWGAFLGAALFALHPLRVESVAWASELKDVLCAALYLAALLAYLRYARTPSFGRYLVVAAAFALALLSKPMAVTFPVVALLLDVWPLGRTSFMDSAQPRTVPPVAAPSQAPTHPGESSGRRSSYGRTGRNLVLEKLPLFALAALSSLATFWAQSQAGSTSSLGSLALELRLLNALRSVGVYLAQSLVPRDLSVFYPHATIVSVEPARELLPGALLGAALLGAGLVLAWRVRRRVPAVTLGIGFFLVTLLPVSGLVQVGTQAHADRYTYLPSVGLVAAVAGAGLSSGLRAMTAGLGLLAALVLGGLARQQVGHWKDTRALFEHALALDARNYLAHSKLGELALDAGDEAAARAAFERARAIHPRDAHALKKLALCDLARGDLEGAFERLRRAALLEPGDPEILSNLGLVELERGEPEAARQWFERCLARAPDHMDALFNLGVLALRAERLDEAGLRFEEVLALEPAHADAWSNLGQVRLARGQCPGALAAYGRVVELAPDDPVAHHNLGVARARCGDAAGARAALERALELDPGLEPARAALAAVADGG
jgi:Flp pilus assembly protein TadD